LLKCLSSVKLGIGISTMRLSFLKEVWQYRELLLFFAWRDLKVRYKQAALGAAWAIFQPLITMLTFTVFFGKLAGIDSSGIPYPLFSFSALLLWTYFSFTLGYAGNSLISNANLITKVYFPRVLLPAAATLGGVFDIAVGSVFLVPMMVYYGISPGLCVLLSPIFVLQLILLLIGASMILAALNVRYRDVKYIIPFIIQIGLFVTPIIYPTTFIPDKYRPLLALNPMTGIIDGFRACLFPSQPFDWPLVGSSWAITLVILAAGAWLFGKAERDFADIV
jgi:lipopolysaccharide transport system permease protein